MIDPALKQLAQIVDGTNLTVVPLGQTVAARTFGHTATGGQLEALTPGLAAAMPHVRNKRVKPIAVTGLKRQELLPDVPTFEESGFKGFDGVQWYGIVGPAKMPREVTERLNAEIGRALASPALQQRLVAEAIEPMPMSPAEFGAFIKTELDRYVALAKERNIRLDE